MIRVYADINCPFCYALNEWVQEAQLDDALDWRVIDHNPRASYRSYTDTELVELTQEVFTIRQRAPDITVNLPRGRSNVLDAGALLCTVKQQRPSMYGALRTRIYRAYWTEGLDIESPSVLQQLAADVGVDDVRVPEEAKSTLAEWTREWNDGPYERRIPTIRRSPSDSLLGLSPKADTLAYLIDRSSRPPTTGDACSYVERVTVAVLGDWSSFWPYGERLRGDCDILYHATSASLGRAFEQPSTPDLVIVTFPELGETELEELATVTDLAMRNRCPTLLLTSTLDDEGEMALYRAGCSEVLALERSVEIGLHKIQQLISHRKMLTQLLESSLTDSLTQLYNRRMFTDVLEQEWLRSSRTQQPLSLLMIDIDHFKKYNDRYGHLAGDGCLREVAGVIKQQATRTADVVCRIGGEEFGVVLPGTDREGAARVAKRMLEAVRARAIEHGDAPLGVVSVSIGATTESFEESVQPSTLVARADTQLYRAKAAGRDTFHYLGDGEP